MITSLELTEILNAKAPRIRITCEALGIDEERLLVEGDRALHLESVPGYAHERIEIAQELVDDPTTNKQGLLGKTRDGKLVRWARGKTLTYAVLKTSFETDERYQRVVDAMTIATSGWMSRCGVKFEHVVDKDAQPTVTTDEVVFRVAGAAETSNLVALAFFPDEPDPTPEADRTIFVFEQFFAKQDPFVFDPIGVIRHEIGHVLGFRHEHIRPEAPDSFSRESLANTQALSDYDPKSIMHYLHPTDPDFGDPKLEFTEADIQGAKDVYGAPDTNFFFVP